MEGVSPLLGRSRSPGQAFLLGLEVGSAFASFLFGRMAPLGRMGLRASSNQLRVVVKNDFRRFLRVHLWDVMGVQSLNTRVESYTFRSWR